MFVLILGLFAAASAAPYYPHQYNDFSGPSQQHGFPHSPGFRNPHFRRDTFDTQSFWNDFETEMRELNSVLEDFYKRFPSSISQEGIQGNQYTITIPLSGYEENDIVVKARTGMLMVQAVHNTPPGSQRNYLNFRTLPDCVNVNGSWTYKEDVLKIVFPVKGSAATEAVPTTSTDATEFQTSAPTLESREEIETNNSNNNQDADVGLGRGDVDSQLRTNEIPRGTVEATTYAVDLKNEYEFVPVHNN